jgi:AcrR family transcriptional regulator
LQLATIVHGVAVPGFATVEPHKSDLEQVPVNIDIESALPVGEEDATRQRILDSARDLYIEFGLRRTTMEDVAKRAGMGRATLYRRFSEKDQLFKAVIMRDAQRSIADIQTAIRQQATFLDGLIESFVLAVGVLHHNPLLSRLLTTEPDHVLPYLTTGIQDIMAYARQFIALQIGRGQAAGHIRPLPADVIAEMILRLVQSLMLTPKGVINAADEASLRDFADRFLRPLLVPLGPEIL